MRRVSLGWLCLLAVPCGLWLPGCNFLAPPEAVLAGTWLVEVEEYPDLETLLITFDETGTVTEVEYKLGDNATITVTDPVGVATVDGQDVIVSVTFNANGLTFNGTLNDDDTEMTGSLTTQISVGSLVVTINNGPATLTLQ